MVVLPEPVGPVTKISPLGLASSRRNGCSTVRDMSMLSSVTVDLRPLMAMMRTTAFSPWLDGMRESRKCAVWLPSGMEKRPFSELGLSPEILKAVDKMGFEEASPIQTAVIPAILAGKDVVGQSSTGSGKTAAFAIPAIERVDPRLRRVQVLVLGEFEI